MVRGKNKYFHLHIVLQLLGYLKDQSNFVFFQATSIFEDTFVVVKLIHLTNQYDIDNILRAYNKYKDLKR